MKLDIHLFSILERLNCVSMEFDVSEILIERQMLESNVIVISLESDAWNPMHRLTPVAPMYGIHCIDILGWCPIMEVSVDVVFLDCSNCDGLLGIQCLE